ncbi:hypothetical protein [Polaromonas sp.]|uniref:hypothetical protein n=1 Tax=Polaromonas sp. TaxID=1869339 RepID=UPI0025CCC0EE|nr:hypothetical protein [Polaromonas sp.]
MAAADNKSSAEQFLASAELHSDGKSVTAFDHGGGGTQSVKAVEDLLFDPIMRTIAQDDGEALQGILDFTNGLHLNVFSFDFPLGNLETNEETMVNMPVMCFAMDREACFGVSLDYLITASKAPSDTHPLLHSLFTSHANAYGNPELPAPRARMAEKLVVGFMEVADSQGQLEVALTLPLPPKILEVAHRVAAKSNLAKMPK